MVSTHRYPFMLKQNTHLFYSGREVCVSKIRGQTIRIYKIL